MPSLRVNHFKVYRAHNTIKKISSGIKKITGGFNYGAAAGKLLTRSL
jgi:hypothetical protein